MSTLVKGRITFTSAKANESHAAGALVFILESDITSRTPKEICTFSSRLYNR